jgi:cation transport ATPase
MSDQPQNPSPETPPPTFSDWREQRRAERLARREARRQRYGSYPSGWFGGAILILIGIIFLLQNLGYQVWLNWWALFLLIPALWFFVAAWNLYQSNRRLTRGAITSLAVGILITLMAIIFLLNLAFGMYWPVLLIVGGLILISSALIPR